MVLEECKKRAAQIAADLIPDGAVVGLGTGSTASYFIKALGKRQKQGFSFKAVASSLASEALAKKENIVLQDLSQLSSIDVYVDGADEVDSQKRMIKGAGGAFFKEKVLAYMAYHFLVIVDETKLVSHLGTKPLPVEVAMFGAQSTQKHLEKSGFEGHFRQKPDGSFYITEHHNYIFDIDLKNRHLNLEQEHLRIKHIPGVIETGFFPCLPGQIIIGCKDGSTVIQ